MSDTRSPSLTVNLVNYEQGFLNGILTVFATRLDAVLKELGVASQVSAKPSPRADVNHHINYLPYHHEDSPASINTLMVTHIWEGLKLDTLNHGLLTADMGVCMSRDMLEKLVAWGLPEQKLATILPAHDGRPRRRRIVAILTNVYDDGCKRERMFPDLVKTLKRDDWTFRIMGSGWNDIVAPLVAEGLSVEYFDHFEAERHREILETADYALYFGMDEGSMGLLDAVNAGVEVIGTPQGFHQEMGLDYSFTTQEELNEIFRKLNQNRVEKWTWETYGKEHLELWTKLSSARR
ncbi:MAG: hypothetical protein ACRD16_06175 [Thermoanaerobaculia bacterium]